MLKKQNRVPLSAAEHLREMEDFCSRWKGTVFAFCRMFLGDGDAAEGVTSEAFVSFVREGDLPTSERGIPSRLLRLALRATEKCRNGPYQPLQGASQLECAIQRLPHLERAVVIMRNLLHMDWLPLAHVVGISESQAAEVWKRGIFQLNDALQRDSLK